MQANEKRSVRISAEEKEKKEELFSPKELRPTAQRLQKRSERHMVRIKPYPKTHKGEESKMKTRKSAEKANASDTAEKSETAQAAEEAAAEKGSEPTEKVETTVSDEAADEDEDDEKTDSAKRGIPEISIEDEDTKPYEPKEKEEPTEKDDTENKAEKDETTDKDKKSDATAQTSTARSTTAKIAVVSPIPAAQKKNDAPTMTRRGATAAGRRASMQPPEMEEESAE